MSAGTLLNEICTFDSYVTDRGSGSREYLFVDAGRYRYLLNVESPSLCTSFMSAGWSEKLGLRVTMWMARRSAHLVKGVPNVEVARVQFKNLAPPDIVIQRHRTKMLDTVNSIVYAFGQDSIRDEYRTRRSLPAEINVPAILEYDSEYPYLVEELIHGRHPERAINDWVWYDRALREIRPLHKRDVNSRVLTSDLISEIPAEDPVVSHSLEILDDLQVPTSLAEGPVHGDLAHKNIMISDNAVYVLDWDNVRDDLLCCDFFYPILDISREVGSAKLFYQMIVKTGTGWDVVQASDVLQSMVSEYASGLPIVYLLHRVNREAASNPKADKAYPILKDLVNQLDDTEALP